MAKRKTRKQKIKTQARKEEERLHYSLPESEVKVKEASKGKQKRIQHNASDRLRLVYPSVIHETRYSIFVSITIFIVYGVIYFLF